MSLSSIKDVIESIFKSFHLSTSFPSLLFVFVNAYFILPSISQNLKLSAPEYFVLLICFSLVISYTIYTFNSPLIRLFEGRSLKNDYFIQMLNKKQRKEFNKKKRKIQEIYQDMVDKGGKISDEEQHRLSQLISELSTYYPPKEEKVLPTKVGNIIAAFENYPNIRYGIDSIGLWTRLVPILKEYDYLEFVSSEKSLFDFLMSMNVIIAILNLEFFYLALYKGNWIVAILLLPFAFILFRLFYIGMTHAARYWGETCNVAYDLFRKELYSRLNLKPPHNFKEEYNRWVELSKFILYWPNESDIDDGTFFRDYNKLFVYENIAKKSYKTERKTKRSNS